MSTRRPGKALETFAAIGDQSVLTLAARNRPMLDVALAQCPEPCRASRHRVDADLPQRLQLVAAFLVDRRDPLGRGATARGWERARTG